MRKNWRVKTISVFIFLAVSYPAYSAWYCSDKYSGGDGSEQGSCDAGASGASKDGSCYTVCKELKEGKMEGANILGALFIGLGFSTSACEYGCERARDK